MKKRFFSNFVLSALLISFVAVAGLATEARAAEEDIDMLRQQIDCYGEWVGMPWWKRWMTSYGYFMHMCMLRHPAQ